MQATSLSTEDFLMRLLQGGGQSSSASSGAQSDGNDFLSALRDAASDAKTNAASSADAPIGRADVVSFLSSLVSLLSQLLDDMPANGGGSETAQTTKQTTEQAAAPAAAAGNTSQQAPAATADDTRPPQATSVVPSEEDETPPPATVTLIPEESRTYWAPESYDGLQMFSYSAGRGENGGFHIGSDRHYGHTQRYMGNFDGFAEPTFKMPLHPEYQAFDEATYLGDFEPISPTSINQALADVGYAGGQDEAGLGLSIWTYKKLQGERLEAAQGAGLIELPGASQMDPELLVDTGEGPLVDPRGMVPVTHEVLGTFNTLSSNPGGVRGNVRLTDTALDTVYSEIDFSKYGALEDVARQYAKDYAGGVFQETGGMLAPDVLDSQVYSFMDRAQTQISNMHDPAYLASQSYRVLPSGHVAFDNPLLDRDVYGYFNNEAA